MALLLFGSVLLHELGHSLVARSQGIKVSSITLFLFGGIAAIDEESKTPGQALQVAIAGPVVSIVLFWY
jgi:Zn-dependent protease